MTTKTTKEIWRESQIFESMTWEVNNRPLKNNIFKIVLKFIRLIKQPKTIIRAIKLRDFYCGDDWNYWWMEQFLDYKDLPRDIDTALEVGCGPYSNIRLISKLTSIKRIVCTDPLMDVYTKFKNTWISKMAAKEKIYTRAEGIENISYPNETFDLVVCNNVLDHVEDSEKGLNEIYRVLKPEGYFVFGQDLIDHPHEGHPINLMENDIEKLLYGKYQTILKRILPKEKARAEDHNGVYVFIGKKI